MMFGRLVYLVNFLLTIVSIYDGFIGGYDGFIGR